MKRDLLKRNISLIGHTSFEIGGIANFFAEPANPEDLSNLLEWILKEGLRPFFFGFGSNLLFPDSPKKDHCYVSLKKMNDFELHEDILTVSCGMPLSLLAVLGLLAGTDRFNFTYLLPGSTGAGLYINARYYEHEMADIAEEISFIDLDCPEDGIRSINTNECQFDYKSSIFQQKRWLIVSGRFPVKAAKDISQDELMIVRRFIASKTSYLTSLSSFLSHFQKLCQKLDELGYSVADLRETEEKRALYRHFSYPSAGSVFKNNRKLGKPIGKIIDEMGLKGKKCGDAMISPYHGNIIINTGKATAADVIGLIDIMTDAILREYGIRPTPEIIITE